MSRIASAAIAIPEAVDIQVNGQTVTVKGKIGTMDWEVHQEVGVFLFGIYS